jgi:MFS transporter, SP family, galactose:H+ symporter
VAVFRRMMLPEEAINREIDEIESNLKQKQEGWKLFLSSGPFRKAIFLGMVLQVIQQLTGINIIMYYAPRIFGMLGFGDVNGQMWGSVLIGIVNILATFIAIAFVDKIGRKPIMYAGFAVMGISLGLLGLFLSGEHHFLSLSGYYAVLALLAFVTGFAMSAGPIIWVLCSEIFPLAGRDLGVTFSTSMNWISNAIVAGTFLTVINIAGKGNTFFLLAGLQVLFILFFVAFVPETKGVSLEHIEANLMAGKPLRLLGEGEKDY